MAELKRKVYGLPCVWLTRFAAPESAGADVPVLRKGRVWFTGKAHDVRAEHGYILGVLAVLRLARRPSQRRHRFSRPCEDGADEAWIDREPVGRVPDALHAHQPAVAREPVEHLVEQPRIAPRPLNREENKGLWVDRPAVGTRDVCRDPHLRPLAPGELEESSPGPIPKLRERHRRLPGH